MPTTGYHCASCEYVAIASRAEPARFRQNNAGSEPDARWDDSVVALLNYPEVLKQMNDDLDWTWQLGEAVVNQQQAVIDAIAEFRERARTAGNLHATMTSRSSKFAIG
ncbi:MAG: DUF3300 domain-containing protein [Pseudomonadales bacterium]